MFVKDCLMNFGDAINKFRVKVGLPKANLVGNVAENRHREDHSEGVNLIFSLRGQTRMEKR